MEVMESFEGMFREYEPLEMGWNLIPKTVPIIVGLIGSEWLLAQASKYIAWFAEAEANVAKVVLGLALILIPKWLKFEGMIAGLLKAIGVGCLVGAGYSYIVDKWGADIGIATLPMAGLREGAREERKRTRELYL